MEFVKERNLIVGYDNGIKMGAWNIITGNFIGKTGKPIKSIPSCFNYNNLFNISYINRELSDSDYLSSMVSLYREWKKNYNYNDIIGRRFEQLISLKLIPYNFNELYRDLILNKNIINYLKTEKRSVYNIHDISIYLAKTQYKNYLSTIPEWAHSTFLDLITNGLPYDYVKTALNRALSEHIGAYEGKGEENSYSSKNTIGKVIRSYYEMSMEMYNKVEVPQNFLTKYAILKYLHNEYKNEHYDEILNKKNNLPWLFYENETFIVRPIVTKDDFHYEGENQHNCVERCYMEPVYNGTTHIVTIRRKTSSNIPYITCEVSNDGRIIQYLAKFNRLPQETDVKAFRKEYQRHLYARYSE